MLGSSWEDWEWVVEGAKCEAIDWAVLGHKGFLVRDEMGFRTSS